MNHTGSDEKRSSANDQKNSFEEAADDAQLSIIAEFILFLRENKAWWLTPILVALLLIAVFATLTSSAIAPFIYPLF